MHFQYVAVYFLDLFDMLNININYTIKGRYRIIVVSGKAMKASLFELVQIK